MNGWVRAGAQGQCSGRCGGTEAVAVFADVDRPNSTWPATCAGDVQPLYQRQGTFVHRRLLCGPRQNLRDGDLSPGGTIQAEAADSCAFRMKPTWSWRLLNVDWRSRRQSCVVHGYQPTAREEVKQCSRRKPTSSPAPAGPRLAPFLETWSDASRPPGRPCWHCACDLRSPGGTGNSRPRDRH